MDLIFNKTEFKEQNMRFLNELVNFFNMKIQIFISIIDSKVNFDIFRFS